MCPVKVKFEGDNMYDKAESSEPMCSKISGHLRINFIYGLSVAFGLYVSYIFIFFFFLSYNVPHSSTLAWKIPWTEEPGGLLSMGSHRVGHDWATSLSLFPFMHWRRKWQPMASQGWGSLVGCCLWGRTESDTTDVT